MLEPKQKIQALIDSFSDEESEIVLANLEALSESSMVVRSPFTSVLGIKVTERGEGTAVAEVKIRPHLMNIVGITHGAVSYGLADVGTGAAASAVLDLETELCVTQDLHYRYVGAIKGDKLIARCSVVKKGRQTIVVEAKVYDKDRLVGIADGTYVILKK